MCGMIGLEVKASYGNIPIVTFYFKAFTDTQQ
jgi:hypothetical protein